MAKGRDHRALRLAEKKARRDQLEAELGARQRALPDKRYGVIYADPPWRFEPYSRITGMDRAAENHYPTSPTAEIKALNVKSIAAADCVLFLWATVPMLEHAFGVMRASGFEPKKLFRVGQGSSGHRLLESQSARALVDRNVRPYSGACDGYAVALIDLGACWTTFGEARGVPADD